MQFRCFKPEHSSLWFQFRRCPDGHPKEMLGFARFLPASSDVVQKFLFGNCVVSFDVVRANTSAGSNKLSDNSVDYRIFWNRLGELDNWFAKSGRSFFQIVNAFCLRFFADNPCAVIPKRIVGRHIASFRFRHSFVICHSSFVISIRPRRAIHCATMPWQTPNHVEPSRSRFSGPQRFRRD